MVNHLVVGTASILIAVAAFGSAAWLGAPDNPQLRFPSLPSPILHNSENWTSNGELESLRQHAEGKVSSTDSLVSEQWPEWSRIWGIIQSLIESAPEGETVDKNLSLQETWIRALIGGTHPELVAQLRSSLKLPVAVDDSKIKTKLVSLAAPGTNENLETRFKAVIDELDQLRKNLDQLPALTPPTGVSLPLAGIDFVWIGKDETDGFWITSDEVSVDTEEKRIASIRTEGIPPSWQVRRPSATEWQTARGKAKELSLRDFDSGLGEVLNDDRILGFADAYEKSREIAGSPMTRTARTSATRKLVQAAVRGLPVPGGGAANRPAIYDTEDAFATRLVIVPAAAGN